MSGRREARVRWGCATVLLLTVACDGNKPGTNSPDGGSDDPGSRMESRESDVATAAPTVEGAQAEPEQKVRPSVQDRDPEEEKRKMAKSRQQSAAARILLGKGRLDEAIRGSREALRIHEQNVDAMLVIAEAYFKQSKWEITLAVCSSALAVDAKIRTPKETSQIHNLRAFAYDRMGEPNLATESFREAAQSDEKNAAAWNNLGTRYLAAGDVQTAAGCLEYALELDPKFAKAHVNYGAALRASGKLPEAEKELVRALQLQPNYAAAYFNLGVLYLDADPFPGLETTQRLNKAIEFLGKYKRFAETKVATGGRDVSKTKGRGETVSKERADDYIRLAEKGLKSEERRKKREAEGGAKAATSDGVTDATGGAADAGDGGQAPDATPAGGDAQPDAGTPAQPTTPGKPTPVQPTKSGQPTQPAQPTPTQPAQPAPTQPAEPTPVAPGKPTQPKPTPTQPAKPTQPKPTPTQPAKPTQPKPVQPKPVQPKPVQPKPVQPKPVQPKPVQPKPVQPK